MVAKNLGFALCASLALLPTTLRAEWHEASSDHFVIYADQTPDQLRKFADRLERYHSALEYIQKTDRPKPSRSNRVNVFIVRDDKQVKKLAGDTKSYIQGFYVPRAGSSIAIVPERVAGSDNGLDPVRILFHEYAHHFLIGSTGFVFPLWLSEGFAEFISTVKFERDGGMGLGMPAMHRGYELMLAKPVPIERLLDTASYLKSKTKAYDEFYGRSWLLYHYLRLSGQRQGELSAYISALLEGKDETKAASVAFGDLAALDKELDKYLRQTKMRYFPIEAAKLNVGEIVIRELDPGEAAAMPIVMQSKRGVDEQSAALLVPKARAVAATYPQDARALAALAEAEYDAGNDAEAIVAADKSLAGDPKNINAHLQKGYALARIMKTADNPAKAATGVRAQFLKINAIENDHPIPLIHFYLSFKESGREPTKNAVDGLEWALDLAPYDQRLRLMVANQQMEDERFIDAEATLLPLAYSPHASSLTEAAGTMLAKARESQIPKQAEK